MMGKAGDRGQEGIIPRLCRDLFDKISSDNDADVQYSVEVNKYFHFFESNITNIEKLRGYKQNTFVDIRFIT